MLLVHRNKRESFLVGDMEIDVVDFSDDRVSLISDLFGHYERVEIARGDSLEIDSNIFVYYPKKTYSPSRNLHSVTLGIDAPRDIKVVIL